MFQEIKDHIWQLKTGQSGPTVTIIGGTHGNERTGVEVVSKLKEKIERGEVKIHAGILNLVHGNPRAIAMNERGSAPHQDLNRQFSADVLTRESDGTYEDQRAKELAPVYASSDVLLDLHATNKPSEPFLACVHTDAHVEVYKWFKCEKILTDSNYVLGGEAVTTDEYIEQHGGIGVCYETGQAADLNRVDEVLDEVINFLKHQGLVEGQPEGTTYTHRAIYELAEPIILTDEGFTFANGYGNGSWEMFRQGDVIGTHGVHSLVANYDGVIVFPKKPEHQQVGKALAYLAKAVASFDSQSV